MKRKSIIKMLLMCVVFAGLLLAVVLVYRYKNEKIFISNYNIDVSDGEMLAIMYQHSDGTYSSTMESGTSDSSYALDESKSYCLHGGIVSVEGTNKKINAKGSDKCYLYYQLHTLASKIIYDNGGVAAIKANGTPDFTMASPHKKSSNGVLMTGDQTTITLSTSEQATNVYLCHTDDIATMVKSGGYFTCSSSYRTSMTWSNLAGGSGYDDSTYYIMKIPFIDASYTYVNVVYRIDAYTSNTLTYTPLYASIDGGTGLYQTQDIWGTSYYFRGSVTNNNVTFAGKSWKIVRINGDGSVRLMYKESGTTYKAKFNDYTGATDNKTERVGYMYTTGSATGTSTSSNAKTLLESWFTTNITGSNLNMISPNSYFCGDRSVYSGTAYGATTATFMGNRRMTLASLAPTLLCPLNSTYAMSTGTTKTPSSGWKTVLSQPIGLITMDELVMAGYLAKGSTFNKCGNASSSNLINHLYFGGSAFWTMTPSNSQYTSSTGTTDKSYLFSSASYTTIASATAYYLFPVINVDARIDTSVSGQNGTASHPYRIVEKI